MNKRLRIGETLNEFGAKSCWTFINEDRFGITFDTIQDRYCIGVETNLFGLSRITDKIEKLYVGNDFESLITAIRLVIASDLVNR